MLTRFAGASREVCEPCTNLAGSRERAKNPREVVSAGQSTTSRTSRNLAGTPASTAYLAAAAPPLGGASREVRDAQPDRPKNRPRPPARANRWPTRGSGLARRRTEAGRVEEMQFTLTKEEEMRYNINQLRSVAAFTARLWESMEGHGAEEGYDFRALVIETRLACQAARRYAVEARELPELVEDFGRFREKYNPVIGGMSASPLTLAWIDAVVEMTEMNPSGEGVLR